MASNEEQRALPNPEEIVKEIWRIVQSDDELEAFDVVVESREAASATKNLAPLSHEDNVLSLKYCYSQELFLFVYRKLLERTLDVENQKAYLTTALLMRGCVKTFWNMRRELVLQNELDLTVELRLVNLVLSFSRKCTDAIYYRQWLLRGKLTEKPLDFLISEISQMEDIASRHGKNNHVPWEYCTWLVKQCDSRPDFADLIHQAWHLSGQYMSCHSYDASHLTYRGKLVAYILRNQDRMKTKFLKLAKEAATKEGIKGLREKDALVIGMVVYEFNLNTGLMTFWSTKVPALWMYRRFLVWLWMVELQNYVSRHGELRLQCAGGCVSDHFCAFDMYLHVRLQRKFFKAIKASGPLVEKYKDWIETFCPGASCWDEEDNLFSLF